MTESVVVEGYARLRDGKKWRTRWLVFRKPSPVADCLVLVVFKDKSDKSQSSRERASVTLEEICGLEPGQLYEGVAFTLAVLCLNQVALLGFDSREALQAWELRLRYGLGEVHRFAVGVLPGTKLESGPATLHLCNNLLALVRDFPPVIIGHWNLPDLRRYGPVPNGFVFEGGTRCGYWAGVFLLASAEGEQISFLFDCIVRGICPSKAPFGLRPVLPELNSGQTNSEEKLNLETQELEKRLSMLSRGTSTVSSTYFPSAGGDDRSISGSSDTSDTSQSDCSIGSRLAIWTEPASNIIGSAKVPLQTVEKLSAGPGGGGRPSVKPPRQLQDIGRQSSSDSGIATGSQSSYSGSFSSYTGSLDIAPGEDFGSVFSLPPQLAQELSPCSCPTAPGQEYQVPSSLLGYLYDSPRRVLHETSGGDKDCEPFKSTEDHPVPSDCPTESDLGGAGGATTAEVQSEATDEQSDSAQAQGPSSDGRKTKALPSSGSSLSCSSLSASKTVVAVCSVCGGFKGNPYIQMSSSGIPTLPVTKALDMSRASTGCMMESPRVQPGDESPKRGEREIADLLSDLLSFLSAGGQPHTANLYESMSPAQANELILAQAAPPRGSQQDKRPAVYENCLKCRGELCQPPLQAAPAKMPRSRGIHGCQSFPTGLYLKKSQGSDRTADEELLHKLLRDVDERCRPEDTNVSTGSEEKKLDGKEERCRADPAYEVMESRMPEKHPEAEEKSKYELMGSYSQQRFLQETEGAAFVFPPEAALPERPRSESVTYVNIPVSPTSKKQLNYMELELQEPGHGTRGTVAHLPSQRKSSTRYAQIDITAMEMAHKVGTQHALGRQEGLHNLELRRKGTPH
ncbi:protein Dok-7-like isoform X1 [Poeciliopsis prolifica]|uniref:protein Dok-7-like isoform X1 n=1 Tax=Poeciliopsis prolifica TaxID=188132 RepID=UPI002413DB35|nr:protein Dok-7-like isoform X1 [Poeciliopsis prolifica]